jgi:phosphatidylglycerol:prolipoprotein diacylglycerol transferase
VAFQSGGLAYYGALAGGALGAACVLRRHRASYLVFADAAAPGVALATAVGRVGCYLAGCDYGTPLSERAPKWLARLGTFPRWKDEVAGAMAGSPAWVDHVLSRRVPFTAKKSLPVHPTELYEALVCLALFGGLVTWRGRRRFHGQLFVLWVLVYGVARFSLERVRGDAERGLWGPLSAPQWMALLSAAAVCAGGYRLLRSSRAGREPA